MLTSTQILVIIVALVPVYWTILSGDPLVHMYPNFLLFTPFREEVRALWLKHLVIDKGVKRTPTHIAEIQAEDYSYETLKYATENFKHPAVVRGLFLGTSAADKWPTPGYLSSKIGKYDIPVVRTALYNTLQNDRYTTTFGEAYEEILADDTSKMYLFFPVQSRFNFNASKSSEEDMAALKTAVNKVVVEDLEIDKRIWSGFGTAKHTTFYGSQLIAGRGSNDSDYTTGTGWHCAIGNNWFVQVAGSKRWYFMDQKYSAYMFPLRGGLVNMMAGNKNMAELQKHIPLRYVDLKAGDLLYNPDWQVINQKALTLKPK
jgi:hypothetical protein